MVYGPMLTQRFSCFAGPQTGLCIWRFLQKIFLTTGLAALRQQSCRRVSVFSPCWPACRKRAPLRRSFLFFLLFLHIKDSLKMMMNGVIDKRFWDVRNDSFYLSIYMIFAPTHPLCHMAYECGVGAQRFSRFAGPQIVLCIWRFLLF